MRAVYLIRHCEPAFPDGRRVCLSEAELPLSRLGRMRAALLARELPDVTRVFCSPLARARETAAALCDSPEPLEGLRELGMGRWEGLPFEEIRARWPELYARRGEAPFDCVPEGGERPADCLARARAALEECLARSEGDVAIVAHAGVNRLLLCHLAGDEMNAFLRLPQPYGCVNRLRYDGGTLTVAAEAPRVRCALTPPVCEALLSAAETPEPVRAHARAVALRAEQLAAALAARGFALNLPLLRAAALLHDAARPEPEHERIGGEWLCALGYPDVGTLIAAHHDLPAACEERPNESAVLYLADKQVRGTERVTLAERFAESLEKCTTPEAGESHARRYRQAQRVERMIERAAPGAV